MHSNSQAPVRLRSIATAVPQHRVDQNVAEQIARRMFASRMPHYDRLSRVFTSTGVNNRHTAVPVEWFDEVQGWKERTDVYVATACTLFEQAATRALERASLTASQVDTVVFVSSTGISTPSIEARMMPAMGFRADASRVPVFGLGCAGGVSGFSLAARLAASRPNSNVLLVVIELCSLSFRLDRATKADVISSSLFADGAAAAVLSNAGGAGPAIVGSSEHLWPETLDIMGWSVDEIGLGVKLSRSLPDFVQSRYREAYDAAIATMNLSGRHIDRVICHPGGSKVLHALERALDVQDGTLDHERGIMRDFGNMSAPTILFVLERVMAQGLPPLAILAALGPGFTASFAALSTTQ
ncbi:MAG: type III polyketide synthase [Candidatus Eremiobacteraeota bacterium]|nr:type III polyketide synthase [Candidatus Eremiobacteraeota bacterium]